MHRSLSWLTNGIVACGLFGCGPSGPVMAPVRGTVTLDGKPLEDGVIYFKRPEQGAVDRMEIRDGTFSGLVEVGNRRVEVCRYRLGEPFQMAGGEIPNRIESIPVRYNRESQLTAVVTEDGPNEFAFAVTSE